MTSPKGKLIVTGGTGFVGMRLIERAIAAGWAVAALVRSPVKLSHLTGPRLSVHAWDIREDIPQAALEGADTVCHAAAFLPPSFADPSYAEACFVANAMGTLDLAQAAMRAGIAKFVLFSSGQIYRYSDAPVSEEDPVYPAARAPFYLSSKLSAELFVQHYHHQSKLSTVILRLSSVYGPGMKEGGLVPQLARRAKEGLAIQLDNGGRYRVDLVHVDDVVTGALAALDRHASGIFNLGSGTAITSLGVAQVLAKLFERPVDSIEILDATDSPAGRGFAILDIGRARAQLGYAPVNFADGARNWLLSS